MKIKTAELTGAALNWAVAMCEGWQYTTARDHTGNYPWLVKVGRDMNPKHYHPSTHWGIGGPIIERESIFVLREQSGFKGRRLWAATSGANKAVGLNDDSIKLYRDAFYFGSTPLVAAMRCYVASKKGEEVDVPEEVTL
jgi:hypothetical protein